MKRRVVETNLDYLRELMSSGLRPVDIWTTAVDQDFNFVRVETDDGKRFEFLMRDENGTFLAHYKEAIKFCGYGAKGLSSLIRAEAAEFGRIHGLADDRVEIHLSRKCLKRLGKPMADALARHFPLRIVSTGSSVSYAFKEKSASGVGAVV